MECNKDEAIRAKSIAEAKLENKDFISARKFAQKAQTLYPGLDGISKMLMTIDVYITSENRINGQINWYGILGVPPTADEETIRKQYRKLALMLHPDKNNSVGAEGAFKLISEASSLLSDKQQRLSYNQITRFNGPQKVPMNTSGPGPSNVHTTSTTRPGSANVHPGTSNVQQKVPTRANRPGPSNVHPGPSNVQQKVPARTNRPSPSNVQPGPSNVQQKVPTKTNRPGLHPTSTGKPSSLSSEGPFTNSAERKPSAPKPQKKTAKVAPAPAKSFWTICSQCRVCHEFYYMHRDKTILCPECKSPFKASEIPKPVTKSGVQKPCPMVPVQRQQQRQSENNNISNSNAPLSDNDRVVPDAKKPGVGQTGPKIQRRTQRASSSRSTKSNTSVDGSKKRTKLDRKEMTGGSKKKTKVDSHNGDANGK